MVFVLILPFIVGYMVYGWTSSQVLFGILLFLLLIPAVIFSLAIIWYWFRLRKIHGVPSVFEDEKCNWTFYYYQKINPEERYLKSLFCSEVAPARPASRLMNIRFACCLLILVTIL